MYMFVCMYVRMYVRIIHVCIKIMNICRFVPFEDGRKPCIYDKNKSSEWKLDPFGFEPMHLDYDPNKRAASSGRCVSVCVCLEDLH